jgi:hypothetical protein
MSRRLDERSFINWCLQPPIQCEKLDNETAILYHHLTAKLLYLSKRTRPDLQTPVSFLATRVKSTDVDDWKKLGRCLRFLCDTKSNPHVLEANGTGIIRWWVDASFAVHPDMKSHTGAVMSMGKGCVYAVSRRQRLNTTSSTEAELVGVSDPMGLILWTKRFLEAQGYTVRDNIVHQDNQSAILLENNGRMSSSKRTRHIDIQYFFVTNHVKQGNLRVTYCPTDDMIGDYFTKPLQRNKVRLIDSETNVSNPALPVLSRSSDSGPSQSTASWIEVSNRRRKPRSKTVKGSRESE